MFDFFIEFKLKNIILSIKMNAEDLLDNTQLDIPDDVQQAGKLRNNNSICNKNTQNGRLSAIVAGEGSRQSLGRELQLSDIDG